VIDVSDEDRALAFANITKAAKHYGIDVSASSKAELGVHPQRHRKESARKAAATRKRKGVAKSAARKAPTTRKKRSR
jgi:hypothetical protein